MFTRRAIIVALAVGVVLGAGPTAVAQYFGMGEDVSSVHASGASTIKCRPEVLRLQIVLSAKAKTLEEAIDKLKAKREAATSKLEELGADAKSVEFGQPYIDTAVSMQQQQMEMMVRQRMGQLGRRNRKPAPKPISVGTKLTAEWKLSDADPEKLLIEAHAIQEKVRGADLAAGDEEESEADAELAEQLAEMGSTYEDPSQLKPGEPVFMYACAVSEEEQSKAYAEAFARAKASAEQLSRAAGIELGPLRGLSAQENPYGNLGNNYFGGYNDPMAQRVQQIVAEQAAASGGRREEAIGSQPNEVTLPVQVTASFDIKQPDKK